MSAMRKSNTRSLECRSCGVQSCPVDVSKADLKKTGQPLSQTQKNRFGYLHECSEGPRRRTTLLPVTGKVCLPIQPQIQLLISH